MSAKPPLGPAAEKHVRYAATVPILEVAWQFVMAHVDEFAEPTIEIRPRRFTGPGWQPDDEWSLEFEVTVAGLVT